VGRGLIEANFENATLEELEVAMNCAPNHRSYLRLRTIWTLGRGFDKRKVSEILGVNYSTLLDWIHAFNERGIDGLIDRKQTGRPRKIDPDEVRSSVLPPYSPDFNPIERFWLRLKDDFFRGFFAREAGGLEERIVTGLRSYFERPEIVVSQCSISVNFSEPLYTRRYGRTC
jgi:hypothetical protein